MEERIKSICSSKHNEFQWLEFAGGQISELCDIRIVEKQNEMPYLNVNSLKIAAIYNADSTQNTVLGT